MSWSGTSQYSRWIDEGDPDHDHVMRYDPLWMQQVCACGYRRNPRIDPLSDEALSRLTPDELALLLPMQRKAT